MKYFLAFSQILLFGFLTITFAFADQPVGSGSSPILVNVIEGTVYDPNHQPVSGLWVELQNELNSSIGRIQTGGSGRFTFTNVATGQYFIKVYATGTDFEDQTVSVEIVNANGTSSDTAYQDVNLRYDKKKAGSASLQLSEVVFAQNVPTEARRLYKSGAKKLDGKDFPKGVSEIDEALKIFPDYYDALNELGFSLVEHKEYQRSLPYLVHAVEINPRSFKSYYSLAYAAFKLNHLPEANEAARVSIVLQPGSINARLLHGTILRTIGLDDEALAALSTANKLSKDSPVAEIHWQLALLYDKLKRNGEEANELDAYLKIKPGAVNKKEIQELIRKLRSNP